MRYTLRVRRSAEKELDRLPEFIHERLSRRILGLEDNPRPQGAKICLIVKSIDCVLDSIVFSIRSMTSTKSSRSWQLVTDEKSTAEEI